MKKKILCIFVMVALMINFLPYITVKAEESTTNYYYEKITPCGDDDGFVKVGKIDEDDPHYGWNLGKFVVSGFTRVINNEDGNPIFLKNVGDTVSFSFLLEQNINKINGNEKWFIADDDGYDEYFGIKESNFGKGILIVRKTDYQNNVEEPVKYKNYLKGVDKNAQTEILLFEEGDYEVSLNYTLRRAASEWGWTQGLLSNDDDYKIFFKFSVRNGNCMSFPRDLSTTSELTNKQITSDGFYLDMAKSHYLDINVKHEVVSQGANELTTDVRFNRPANDGDKYTDEGIYTITTKNRYTDETTEKIIYVGDDYLLFMLSNTGLSISEVNEKLSAGAYISDDGMLLFASDENNNISTDTENNIESLPSVSTQSSSKPSTSKNSNNNEKEEQNNLIIYIIIGIVAIIGATIAVFIIKKKTSQVESKE